MTQVIRTKTPEGSDVAINFANCTHLISSDGASTYAVFNSGALLVMGSVDELIQQVQPTRTQRKPRVQTTSTESSS